jgi:hypothetical protein
MSDIERRRVTAELDGDFVVYRIGMRINTLWKVHRWLPVLRAMPKMLAELESDPDSGLLGYDTKLGIRNHEVVQYWRSFEQLRAYALDAGSKHAPAMERTNELMEDSDAVGLWHETYLVEDGAYETVYHNTPPIGLGKAGTHHPATDSRQTAVGRLGITTENGVAFDGNDGQNEQGEMD